MLAIAINNVTESVPSQDQITNDARSAPQRTHDALLTVCRAMLSSGPLGQHNGLPVTMVTIQKEH